MTDPATTRKTALVTGGARGIGRAIVEDLSRDHSVVLLYNTTRPEWAVPEIRSVQGDLRDPKTAPKAVATAIEAFGRLDVIVHNAGLVAPTSFETFELDAAHSIFDVNTFAAHALLAAALPHLQAGAAMVNISSVNATLPPKGASLYGASKAALELWTRAAAKEMGPRGVRVNAVSPGAIDIEDAQRDADLRQAFIDMTALERMGTPQDVAEAVRFMASDAASFITGEVLVVSGGYRL